MFAANPNELKKVIEKAQKGDKDAFSYLYKIYFTPLYRYIYYRVGSGAEAEDLTQDVFLKAYISFPRYSYSGTSPLAYFYTIARNTVIDYQRKKKIAVAEEDMLLALPDTEDTPQEKAMKYEDAEMVRLHIRRLPEDQQGVIVLRFIDELSTKETASLLGKSEEAVRQLQSRGLRLLRKYISYE